MTGRQLAAAYFELEDNKVPILAAMDHVSQESIYLSDPDGNIIELYWERPDAHEFRSTERRQRRILVDAHSVRSWIAKASATSASSD